MKISVPHFYSPEPDPEERPTAIMPEDLSPEALRELLDLAGYELTVLGQLVYPRKGNDDKDSTF